ncbi:S41 family peptidase [Chitinophaga sancti]|uniref:S41 family peptidase n=1 Tax=Chitinophaga sancti TaxID=1004 RepID=UPI002A74D922|nr:S41 family peptidase [Chitinophaga sancti]WPQ63787.1 S41 family peptidase [Chitinophaga sancti]
MMTRLLLTIILSSYLFPAIAQECACKSSLQYLIDKVAKNYIGFPDKVTTANEKQYHAFTDSLMKVSDTASMPVCFSILQKWTTFFQDKHLMVIVNRGGKHPMLDTYFPRKTPVKISLDPSFKILNDQTCLLTIPSARLEYKGIVDSLLVLHKDLLSKTSHFIIDVRENRGGSTLVFDNLLPYLYTNPIITEGAMVLATEENIHNLYEVTDYPNVSDSMKAVFKKEAAALKAHIGREYQLWNNDTTTMNQVFPYPQKVSLLINHNVGSSTEMFVLKARQSKKVKLFGTHTAGVVDYSDVVPYMMPCTLFAFGVPSSRTLRMPAEVIDNIGIAPNVEIPADTTDWVQYVVEHR